MREEILSVGIDIGTSTTQLIFSRLVLENRASSYTVPRIDIVEKEVIYRSKIYFTPLLTQNEIDGEKVKEIVKAEYQSAGIKPEDLKTGAVIITGETARKSNANTVLAGLSDMAGEFVVATAGPDLESVLSAKGAGADVLSEEKREVIANVDMGGGTSNVAFFQKGALRGTSCMDIGGRLIKVENGKISYIFHKIKKLAEMHQIQINVGDPADEGKLYKVCELMADQLAMGLHLKPADAIHAEMYTNDGEVLPDEPKITGITFSGGVADCVNRTDFKNTFEYGDIGVLLGRAIRENQAFKEANVYPAVETIRATVVGAGSHTTNVSGSTISYAAGELPIKNIPVCKVSLQDEKESESFKRSVQSMLDLYKSEGEMERVAIAFSGEFHMGFAPVQQLAKDIVESAQDVIKSKHPLILVIEQDIAKVLGNAINVLLERKKDVICIDGINVQNGDYIDIGEPVGSGRVVPVVTKTLVFNSL